MTTEARAHPDPPEVLGRGSSPLALRLAFALSVALFFWSFVGGAAYLIVVWHRLPLQVHPLDEARWRLARGDVEGAVREYRRYSQISPFDASARQEAGRLLLREGRLDEAALAYEAALRLQPRAVPSLAGLGEVRLAQGRFAAAAALFESALTLEPDSPALHNSAGKAHALGGDLDRAIEQFRAALAAGPDPHAAANLERALAQKAERDGPRGGAR